MMRTLVAALTACVVCLLLAGCGNSGSAGGGKVEKREVNSDARTAPGAGASMTKAEDVEGSGDSPDQ